MIALRPSASGVDISVKAVPRSSRDRVAGIVGDRLKVCVAAAPEKGKANERVAETVAAYFGLPPSAVTVIAGHASPRKTLHLKGLTRQQALERLASA